MGRGGGEERRTDPTVLPGERGAGKTYTRSQFVEFYGGERAGKLWRKAGRAAPAVDERRRDPTMQPGQKGAGKTYALAEFTDFYGAERGKKLWRQAGALQPARAETKRTVPGFVKVKVTVKRGAEDAAVGWSRDTSKQLITSVEAGSPAAAAGIAPKMKIKSIAGKSVTTDSDVTSALAGAGAEFEVELSKRAAPMATQGAFSYPVARRSGFKEELHGQDVRDPYRWMESDSPELEEWIRQENVVTSRVLKQIPWREKVKKSLTAQYDYAKRSAPYKKGSRWYYSHNTGLQNQFVIYVKNDIHDEKEEAKVFCDPNKLAEDGTTTLGGNDFTQSGKYWAYSIKKKGSDWQHVHVKNCETGEDMDDYIQWVKFSGISWTHDEKGFFYSRYPAPESAGAAMTDAAGTETDKNENHALYYHVLGTPQSADVKILDSPDHPKWMFGASVTDDGRYAVISVGEGCAPENLLWYVDLKDKDPKTIGAGDIVKLVDEFEWEYEFVDNDGAIFFIQTTANAPKKKLLRVNLSDPAKDKWQVAVAENENPLQWVSTGKGGVLYLCYMEDVKDVVYRSTLAAPSDTTKIPLEVGSVTAFNTSNLTTEVFFSFTSFTFPNRIYTFDAAVGFDYKLWYESKVPGHDSSKFTSEQVFFKSKDGTKIPMFLVYKTGMKRDRSNCTLLYGYGGFRISLGPAFSPFRLTFLNNFNGVFALANIRGGSEYGEEWWKEAIHAKKQTSYDDFQAAARWLAKSKITTPERLTIMGGSNGGLLVAACANQAPSLFCCVICQVGVLDLERFHKFTIGHAWTSDFGDPDKKEDFGYIRKISPLHNIKAKQVYPAMMCLTGDHDDRVVPLHTFKYVAELQHKCGKQAPPLLARIEVDAGHGAGKPTAKVIEEMADAYSFLTHQCGARWHGK